MVEAVGECVVEEVERGVVEGEEIVRGELAGLETGDASEIMEG
jgi:hypothetical protein